MSDRDDTDGVLHRFFTDDHGERLLTGDVGTGDGDVVSLAGLFAVLRAPAEPAELAGTDDVVARLAATVRDARGESVRKPVRARAFTVKVAVVATVAVLSAGAAAAATGHLPDGLQRTVSHTLSHIGVDVPAPQHGTDTPTDPTTTTAATAAGVSGTPTTAAHDAVGADATGAAKTGLCRAYVANDGHGHSRDAVAFQNLTDAATNAGQTVAEFCAPTTTTTVTTGETAKPNEPGNSGSTPAATAPGKPTEPGNSGSTPAATAPGHSGSTPAATAPGRSDAGHGHGRP